MPNIDILPAEDINVDSLLLTETDTVAKKGYFRKSSIASLLSYIQNFFVKKTDFSANASIQKRANTGTAIENQTIVNMLKEYLFDGETSKIAITTSGGQISQKDYKNFENVINIMEINGFYLRYKDSVISVYKGSCRSENNEKDIILESVINITPGGLSLDETYYLFIDYYLNLFFTLSPIPANPDGQRLIGAFRTHFTTPTIIPESIVGHANLHNHGVYGVNLPADYIENFNVIQKTIDTIEVFPGRIRATDGTNFLNNILSHKLTKNFDHNWGYGDTGGLRDDLVVLDSQYYLYSISKNGKKNDIICSLDDNHPNFPVDYDYSKMIGVFKSHPTFKEIKEDSYFKTSNIDAIGSVSKFLDLRPSGEDGGDTTSGSWITRYLNTEKNNQIPTCKLITNSIILPSGAYMACIHTSLAGVDIKFRLFDDTNSVSLLSSQINDYGVNEGALISFSGYFKLASQSTLYLQYYAKNNVNRGLGRAWNVAGEDEVFSIINLTKVR